MAGLVMLDVHGLELNGEDRELLRNPFVGGLILFARNYQSRAQLGELVGQVRACREDLLIAVDQEGGKVQRFREGFEMLPPLQKIADLARRHPQERDQIAFSLGWLMAAEVLSAGVDISFAPVLDLDYNSSPVISDRSFSDRASETTALAQAYIGGMRSAGMAATAKHFPGHGGVSGDSHEELPIDDRTLAEIESRDLVPFVELLGVYQGLMPGHLLFPSIDSRPVGFSSFWLRRLLRERFGFSGVIFSDDLSMEGAAWAGSYAERASLALEAGCDMLLVCNNRTGALEVLAHLEVIEPAVSPALAQMRAGRVWQQSEVEATDTYEHARSYIGRINELDSRTR